MEPKWGNGPSLPYPKGGSGGRSPHIPEPQHTDNPLVLGHPARLAGHASRSWLAGSTAVPLPSRRGSYPPSHAAPHHLREPEERVWLHSSLEPIPWSLRSLLGFVSLPRNGVPKPLGVGGRSSDPGLEGKSDALKGFSPHHPTLRATPKRQWCLGDGLTREPSGISVGRHLPPLKITAQNAAFNESHHTLL